LLRYVLLVVGIDQGALDSTEPIVEFYHQFVMVRDISEMLQGRAGYNVLKKMISDPMYSKLSFYRIHVCQGGRGGYNVLHENKEILS